MMTRFSVRSDMIEFSACLTPQLLGSDARLIYWFKSRVPSCSLRMWKCILRPLQQELTFRRTSNSLQCARNGSGLPWV
jgi:hypothetical protein